MSDSSYVFQSVVAKKPAHVIAGKGCRITVQKDGKVHEDIIDAVTGAAVGALGWGDEDVGKFMAEVLSTTTYTFPAIIGNQHSENLAKFYINILLKEHLLPPCGVVLVPKLTKTL